MAMKRTSSNAKMANTAHKMVRIDIAAGDRGRGSAGTAGCAEGIASGMA